MVMKPNSAQARGGNGGMSSYSTSWTDVVIDRIHGEAKSAYESIPPYFRRFDAFGNDEHPSIFKPRLKPQVNQLELFAITTTSPAHGPGQPPLDSAGGERGQLRRPPTPETDKDHIVVAAVGPYHHRTASAQQQPPPLITCAKKCGIVKYLTGSFNLDVVGFLQWVQRNEERARRCYERESFQMNSQEFAEMLLLDGCVLLFAIFLLRPSIREDKLPAELAADADHGREFRNLSAHISFHMKQTTLDLLVLHNQIPFFVLTELHSRLKNTFFAGVNYSLEELALSCFQDVHPFGLKEGDLSPTTQRDGGGNGGGSGTERFPQRVHHLLHLFHWSLVPGQKYGVDINSIPPREPESHLPSATELEESLTIFTKQKDAKGSRSSCCLDITFESSRMATRGVMRLPALHIHGYSEAVFRNLIAFEQNHLRCGHGVTTYAICMARLLQSDADARLLRNSGILPYTQRTDKEIVDFFRQLVDECRNTCMPDDLIALCKDVAAHHQSTGVRVMKGFVLQCFPKQTITFFVIFGAIISIATLIDTVHSMYRYYHPRGNLPPMGR
uniref:Uncharacterized protein n=1 Tax=Oryza glumipatula TaxID=40148 RepID=A0A0E0B0H9_9ORYZ